MRKFKLCHSVFVLILCLSGVIVGQERVGAIEGTVKDPNGAAVPGATVIVTSQATTTGARPDASTAYNRTVKADGSGFFRLTEVPPGFYNISVEPMRAFGGATISQVEVVLGKTTPINIALGLAGQSATV